MDKNNKKPIHELLVYRLRFFNRVFVIIAILQKRKYHLYEIVLLCFNRLRAVGAFIMFLRLKIDEKQLCDFFRRLVVFQIEVYLVSYIAPGIERISTAAIF